MRNARLAASAVVITALALTLTGCYTVPAEEGSRPWDPKAPGSPGSGTIEETVDIARAGAESVQANVTMGAGELVLRSEPSSGSVLTGTVQHPKTWPTRSEYSVEGTEGVLTFTQDRATFPVGDASNRWELALAEGVPMRLAVALGAGKSELTLGSLDLDDLQVTLGAGETEIDLTGPRTRDLPVSVQAGVGELRLVLPSDVGVRVNANEQGIGDFNAEGFTLENGHWTNEAWNGPGPKIDVQLEQGIGEVNLELAP